jgi:hypothetical protein
LAVNYRACLENPLQHLLSVRNERERQRGDHRQTITNPPICSGSRDFANLSVDLPSGGEGGIRTHVPELPDHPISSRRRYDHFGTSPINLKIAAFT